MIIKSIDIQNFLSYYDNSNRFNFDSGATLIIGQNNTGKSKLFDAYNWVLYDEAYKTASEDWKSTSEWRDELANKLAKKQCPVMSWVNISVCLAFEDEENNHYIVTRDYRIQKLNENEWNTSSHSELNLTKKTSSSHNTITYSGDDASQELGRFFPKNLSRYFLFQGEGISKLLRLNKRSDFTRAISELSGIKYFSKASLYANKVYERLKYEFDSKEDRDSEVQLAKLKLSKEIAELTDKLGDLSIKLENEYRERDIKKQKLDDKIEELSKYEECAKLLQEIRILEKERDEKTEQRKVIFEFNRTNLLGTWIYGQVKDKFLGFLQLYRKGKDEQKIPEPIRQDFILQMLQEQMCKICGTTALEGSDAYEHIALHINERSLDREVAIINNLGDAADSMNISTNQLQEEVSEFRERLQIIQGTLSKLRDRIDYKEEELRIVIEHIEEEKRTRIDKTDIEKVNLIQLKKDRDQIRVDLETSKGKIDQLIGRKEETEKSLIEKEKESQRLVERSSNEIERKRMQLAEKIKNHAERLHHDFLSKLINDIESEANDYFGNMTKTNAALSGIVRVDYDNQEIFTVDEQGRRMTNINQANKVSLQIAFVAAVLSVSNKIWDNHFPFVADAPISALGGNNKLSAIKTMIDIFRQSIIILKDDAQLDSPESVRNDEVRQLIQKNQKIHNAYELRMVSNMSIEEQNTEVIKLK